MIITSRPNSLRHFVILSYERNFEEIICLPPSEELRKAEQSKVLERPYVNTHLLLIASGGYTASSLSSSYLSWPGPSFRSFNEQHHARGYENL